MTTHQIKTSMPFYQDIVDGKKPFEFRKNDHNYQVGDQVKHVEFDEGKQELTGRTCWTTITYLLEGGRFGVPDDYCVFAQHTMAQTDFVRDYNFITTKMLPEYEDKLPYKRAGNITERLSHVLSQFNDSAMHSVLRAKNFIDDVKTQFKALEIVIEGVTSEAYNHGQKRVIANHVINMLRTMIDKIDGINWEYSSQMYERYNFFRSDSPEHNVLKRYKELKDENDRLKQECINANERLPADRQVDLPF